MSQLKKKKIRTQTIFALYFFFILATGFSCAKKPATIRSPKIDESINMNPAVSNQAEQVSSAKDLAYIIKTVTRPTASTAGFTIDSDILTPDKNFLPLTTTHDVNGSISQGNFQDSARGLVIDVKAQCAGPGCTQYLLLLTVTKSNVAIFQSAAVSYKDDLKFYTLSIAAGSGQNFFQNLEELNGYSQSHNFTAKNDCTENDCPGGN